MTAEAKKNKDMANVAPGTYDSNLHDKKKDPQWSIRPRIQQPDKSNLGPGPGGYDIPSKMVEKQGKTIAPRLKSSLDGKSIAPGPGTYVADKPKLDDLQFSIGKKLNFKTSNMQVPGPGAYERYHEPTIGTKFSKDERQSMEAKGLKGMPGPG